jgi:subtilisin
MAMTEENTKTPGGAAPPSRTLVQGRRECIIAPRRGSQALAAGMRPMSAGAVRAVMGQLPGLEIVRVLRPRRAMSALSLTPDEASEVYVAAVEADRAELIGQTMPPQLIMEENVALEYGAPAGLGKPAPTRLASWSTQGNVETRQLRFRVIGGGDRPLANVGVSLAGEGFPHEGRTDRRGEVALSLIALPGRGARSLFVSAPHDYWDQYLTEPELSDAEINVVRLRGIEETIAGFPEHFRYGWGQLQMGLDRIPESVAGRGVKIAIVDSGVDTTHPLLRHIRRGFDITNNGDPDTWAQDPIGHGTHCAGIIAASDETGKMMRGFSPDAEVHVLKVFPGGRFSSLIEALDYCLELEIDIVNLSLGSSQRSQVLEQKLEELALEGIACIAAGGNSGGAVMHPASSPYTLAIGAVGRLNEFPDTAWEATTVLPGLVATDGIFSPGFSCSGPEVAVCAPGVAVVSTAPGGFEPLSGTSVAAPHVTGFAALLLGHHPVFQGPLRARNQLRVVTLFNMIRRLCTPYGFGALRAGAGLPRLHGLEHVLLPTQPPGRPGPSGWNGQTTRPSGVVSGMPVGQPVGVFFAPQDTGSVVGTSMLDPAQVAPLYVQAQLAAQAWPVQALLESLRLQYLGG